LSPGTDWVGGWVRSREGAEVIDGRIVLISCRKSDTDCLPDVCVCMYVCACVRRVCIRMCVVALLWFIFQCCRI